MEHVRPETRKQRKKEALHVATFRLRFLVHKPHIWVLWGPCRYRKGSAEDFMCTILHHTLLSYYRTTIPYYFGVIGLLYANPRHRIFGSRGLLGAAKAGQQWQGNEAGRCSQGVGSEAQHYPQPQIVRTK